MASFFSLKLNGFPNIILYLLLISVSGLNFNKGVINLVNPCIIYSCNVICQLPIRDEIDLPTVVKELTLI